MDSFPLLCLIVAITLAFDFSNGWHDAANSIATVVSTRVLTPLWAVIWAAFWNFVAAFVFGTAVAKTIGRGLVHIELVNEKVLIAGLLGAILWNLFTLALGLPTSSSHALMGGYGGAAVARAGFAAIIVSGWIRPVIFIFIAPVMGTVVAIIVTEVPYWVIICCHLAMAGGTMSGGWRVVKTMGQRITKLNPFGGFAAETAGALTLAGTAHFGIPVSTTHTITGAIVGVGATRRLSAVRWGVTRRIVWAWVVTIPGAAALGALLYELFRLWGR